MSLLQAEGCLPGLRQQQKTGLLSDVKHQRCGNSAWVFTHPGHNQFHFTASFPQHGQLGYWSVTTTSLWKLFLYLAEFLRTKAPVWGSWTPKKWKMWKLQLTTLPLTINLSLSAVVKFVDIVVAHYPAASKEMLHTATPTVYCRPNDSRMLRTATPTVYCRPNDSRMLRTATPTVLPPKWQ